MENTDTLTQDQILKALNAAATDPDLLFLVFALRKVQRESLAALDQVTNMEELQAWRQQWIGA